MTTQEWQPIETAPKDETPILVYDQEHSEMSVAQWVYDPNGFCWSTIDGCYHEGVFTHWMPLPKPPAGGRVAKAEAQQ